MLSYSKADILVRILQNFAWQTVGTQYLRKFNKNLNHWCCVSNAILSTPTGEKIYSEASVWSSNGSTGTYHSSKWLSTCMIELAGTTWNDSNPYVSGNKRANSLNKVPSSIQCSPTTFNLILTCKEAICKPAPEQYNCTRTLH